MPFVAASWFILSCPGPRINVNVSVTDNTLNKRLTVLDFIFLCENTEIYINT